MVFQNFHLSQLDYCNGVGGISGASGRGTSVSSGPSSISNMTTRQQQQTLIYLLEKLVTLNHELQRNEAAMGVLDFAHKYLRAVDSQTEVKERWYEKLHQWQKALNIYEKELNVEQPLFAHRLPGGASSYLVNEPSKLNENKLEQLMGRMRCLKGLGEWKKLHYSCQDMLNFFVSNQNTKASMNDPIFGLTPTTTESLPASLHTSQSAQNVSNYFGNAANEIQRKPSSNVLAGASNIGNIVVINPSGGGQLNDVSSLVNSDKTNKETLLNQLNLKQQTDYKSKIAEMGAAACWGLGDWEQMQNYVNYLPENSFDCQLYKSVLALTLNRSGSPDDEKQNALALIEHSRDLLDTDLTSMASQSYERSYQAIIDAQVNFDQIYTVAIRII